MTELIGWAFVPRDCPGEEVSGQLTSVDPYPTDTNLYGHRLPAPNTHGSLQAVLIAAPLSDLDSGQEIPQDASVKLNATF